MARIFQLPQQVPIVGGSVSPNAQANFYLTGTTTRTNTYTDAALTTPHTNPVLADAAGVFPVIYLDPDVIYRLVLNDEDLALIYDEDPIQDALTQANIGRIFYPRTDAEVTAGVIPTNYYYPTGDVRRYGAVGDGATDDTAAIQAAVDVVSTSGGIPFSAGGFVTIPEGIFQISSSIVLARGVGIQGAGREATVIEITSTNIGIECASFCFIQDLWIQGNATSSHGIEADSTPNVRISRVKIGNNTTESAVDVGIRLVGLPLFSIVIEDCYINGTRSHGIEFANNAQTRANFRVTNTTVRASDFDDDGTAYNLDLNAVSNVLIDNCVFEQEPGQQNAAHIRLQNSCNSIVIQSCYFEDRQTTRRNAIEVASSNGLVVMGNWFDGLRYALETSGSGMNSGTIIGNRTINEGTGSINIALATDDVFVGLNVFASNPVYTLPRNVVEHRNNIFYVRTDSSGSIDVQQDGSTGLRISPRGLSATATRAENLRGSVTFATAATATVTFGTAEPDATYFVSISGSANETFWVTGKLTTGFTMNSSNASSTATVDWVLIR